MKWGRCSTLFKFKESMILSLVERGTNSTLWGGISTIQQESTKPLIEDLQKGTKTCQYPPWGYKKDGGWRRKCFPRESPQCAVAMSLTYPLPLYLHFGEGSPFPLTSSYMRGASWGQLRVVLWNLRFTVKWCLTFHQVLPETLCGHDEKVVFGKCLHYHP